MTPRTKVLAGFVVVAGLYVAAAAVTIGTGGHPFRPLYEGVGPSAPYQWVHPPPAFKATNIEPLASSLSLELTAAGSEQSGAATPDGQLVFNLPSGAIPARPAQQGVAISIEPVDPAKLGRLPAGLFSDGNAYLTKAGYEPDGKRIDSAAKPIDAVLRTPVSSVALLASSDGKVWVRIPDHHIPNQAAIATTFTQFGYLLAAANAPVVPSSPSSGTSILLVVLLGIAAAALVGLSVLWRTGRRRAGG